MKSTLKDNGKIWLFRHKVFGLSTFPPVRASARKLAIDHSQAFVQ